MSDNFFVILMAKVEVDAHATAAEVETSIMEFTTTRSLTYQVWTVAPKELAIIEAVLGPAAATALIPPALAKELHATSQASDSPIITFGGGQ